MLVRYRVTFTNRRIHVRAGRGAEHRLRRSGRATTRHADAPRGNREGDRAPQVARVQADGRQGGAYERRRPVPQGHVLEGRPHRLLRGAIRPDDRGQGPGRGRRRRGFGATDRRADGRDRGVQRRGGVPAPRAGNVGVARSPRRDPRAARRLPYLCRDADPDRVGDRGADDGIPAPVHPRRVDGHQHGHADPRLDDRVWGSGSTTRSSSSRASDSYSTKVSHRGTQPPRPAHRQVARCCSPA